MDSSVSSTIAGRRGIYLLPNLFTMGALFAGFYAIISASHQYFSVAAVAIFISMLLDGLDGRVARLTHSQTEFGAQFDSLSDMVCFGVSPAIVLYDWMLSGLGKLGWLVAFVYVACTALRLARFNSQSQNKNKRYFQGLSTTACAGFSAGMIWVGARGELDPKTWGLVIAVITVLLALLKVSTIRYRSFKDFDMRNKVPFIVILALVLMFVLISMDPALVLFTVFSLYVLSGPFMTVIGLIRTRKVRRAKKSE